MVEDISREDFETAVLKNLLEINKNLTLLAEAIAMLAQEMGCEFQFGEDATA